MAFTTDSSTQKTVITTEFNSFSGECVAANELVLDFPSSLEARGTTLMLHRRRLRRGRAIAAAAVSCAAAVRAVAR